MDGSVVPGGRQSFQIFDLILILFDGLLQFSRAFLQCIDLAFVPTQIILQFFLDQLDFEEKRIRLSLLITWFSWLACTSLVNVASSSSNASIFVYLTMISTRKKWSIVSRRIIYRYWRRLTSIVDWSFGLWKFGPISFFLWSSQEMKKSIDRLPSEIREQQTLVIVWQLQLFESNAEWCHHSIHSVSFQDVWHVCNNLWRRTISTWDRLRPIDQVDHHNRWIQPHRNSVSVHWRTARRMVSGVSSRNQKNLFNLL